MYRELTPKGVRVPYGFAVTAQAYRYMLEKAGIAQHLRDTLAGLRPDDVEDLARRGKRARALVYGATLPDDLQIVTGSVRIIADPAHLMQFRPGEVLVADTTTPDWELVMKTAGAVVTNRGGRYLSRGDRCARTLHAEGDVGRIYGGKIPMRRAR